MDAKCPQCEKVAVLDDEITTVKCHLCGFEAKFDDYLDLMKERVGGMVENFNPDKTGF